MKMTNTEHQKGSAIIETIIVIVIIIIIIALFVQKKRPASYYLNEAKKTTTQQNVIEPPTTTSTSTTTTTTTTQGGLVTTTNMPPSITLYGANPYQIFHPGVYPDCQYPDRCPPRTDFYSEPGYKATDREDGDITSKVIVADEFEDTAFMNPCRKYNKKYTVTDKNGATTTARRVVNECNGM